jgi:hypothetical protein
MLLSDRRSQVATVNCAAFIETVSILDILMVILRTGGVPKHGLHLETVLCALFLHFPGTFQVDVIMEHS